MTVVSWPTRLCRLSPKQHAADRIGTELDGGLKPSARDFAVGKVHTTRETCRTVHAIDHAQLDAGTALLPLRLSPLRWTGEWACGRRRRPVPTPHFIFIFAPIIVSPDRASPMSWCSGKSMDACPRSWPTRAPSAARACVRDLQCCACKAKVARPRHGTARPDGCLNKRKAGPT